MFGARGLTSLSVKRARRCLSSDDGCGDSISRMLVSNATEPSFVPETKGQMKDDVVEGDQ